MILLRLGWWIKGWCEDFPYSPINIQRNAQCLPWKGGSLLLHEPQTIPIPCEWNPPEINHLKWHQ